MDIIRYVLDFLKAVYYNHLILRGSGVWWGVWVWIYMKQIVCPDIKVCLKELHICYPQKSGSLLSTYHAALVKALYLHNITYFVYYRKYITWRALQVRTVKSRAYLIQSVPAHICTLYHTQPNYVFRYRIHNTKVRWRGTHGGEGATHNSNTKYVMYRTGMLAHVIAELGVRNCSSALPIKYGPFSQESHRCHRWERYKGMDPWRTFLLPVSPVRLGHSWLGEWSYSTAHPA
jgi:hypothetical protein